jgi:hypothetical protein
LIVVKIELHSAVDGLVEEIGRMYIANVGGTCIRGDYAAAVCRRGSTEQPRELSLASAADPTISATRQEAYRRQAEYQPKAARVGEVLDYPRLSYNVWRLVCRAVRSCFPEEK